MRATTVNRRVASSNLARGANFLWVLFSTTSTETPKFVSNLKLDRGNFCSNSGVESACEDCKDHTFRSVNDLDFCSRLHVSLGIVVSNRRYTSE